jgi:hypothetical protein
MSNKIIVAKITCSDDCDEIADIIKQGAKFVLLGKVFHKLDFEQFEIYQNEPYAPIELDVIYNEHYINRFGTIEYCESDYFKRDKNS